MKCKVLYFGMIGERLKKDSEYIATSDFIHKENDLITFFLKKYPQLEDISFRIAINGVITNSFTNEKIESIALLPPYAGG